jgi:hypothetical protein
VRNKRARKCLKWKELIIEIQSTWNLKIKLIPAVIRVTKNISKSFRKYLSSLPGNHDIKGYRKQPY